jgi:hypothetical protein
MRYQNSSIEKRRDNETHIGEAVYTGRKAVRIFGYVLFSLT